MSTVFLSYARADLPRVGQLVQAIEKHGLSVWWDRSLAGGDDLRAGIAAARAPAPCVVVLWSQASTGPSAGFVRDEAQRGAKRGILVPVLLEHTSIPLGFGELQAIDLTHWRGSARDPFLLDLVAAIRARIAGLPAPPARGPMKRLLRRLAFGAAGTGCAVLGAAVAINAFGLQDRLCALPVGQPGVSDACGAFGLGGRPSLAERIAWAQRPPGSCDGLRAHIEQFPDGVYRTAAAGRLTARRITEHESWVASEKPLALYVGRDAHPAPDTVNARSNALARAQTTAERRCRDFAASGLHRFTSARVEADEWLCEPLAAGMVCSFEGRAVCSLEEQQREPHESCAEPATP